MSLYKKHRPKTLDRVIGQTAALAPLIKMVDAGKIPHALLISGPSGCGKTTIGRILQQELECGDFDYVEINSADFKGIEMVRKMRTDMGLAPVSGKVRMWLIDEAHKLTNDAQNALLKMLEDTPRHVYFILSTTDPQKLIKAIHTRCTLVKLGAISHENLNKLLREVADAEDYSVSDTVVDEICEAADGSARKALVILEQVGPLDNEKRQLESIQSTTFSKDAAIDLARALVSGRAGWPEVAKILRGLADEDPEGIRYCVLGYARACMVGSENKPPNVNFARQAFKVVDIFSKNFYDSKNAGLAAACWEVICL